MSFRDHFSARAAAYVRFRPSYPDQLYTFLASLVPRARLAWDCATGSGQAAAALARHVDRVLATDASPDQLAHATPHSQVVYALAYAENCPAADHTFDIVSVAAAAHWFDLERFYAEVRRVTRPGGVIAMWSYYMFESEPAIVAVMDRYAHRIVGDYWPERMHYNQAKYAGLPFPFERVPTPAFSAEAEWSLDEVIGFATTWSATQRYQQARRSDPLERIRDELERAWGPRERRVRLRWPLHALVGRVP